MNRKLFSTIALSLAALSVGSAFAAQPGTSITRQQVLAELADAQRTGDIVEVHGSTIKKLNELHPASYPAKAEQPGLTRAQVLAELAEAQRTGEIVVVRGATMKKLNEFEPGKYPTQAADSAQVFAESAKAKQTESM